LRRTTLDRALEEAGIDRGECYVTNAMKHFKWEPRGKRRIHQKPNTQEIAACRPWWEAELSLIRPEIIICLGSTAAQAVMGRAIGIMKVRGQFLESEHSSKTLITVHPSALLRIPDHEEKQREFAHFVRDLKRAKEGGASTR
jgi:DNA polymerase